MAKSVKKCSFWLQLNYFFEEIGEREWKILSMG